MTDKDLIKNYKDTYKEVSKKPTEKGKKIYINAFNAFDTKLNKDLENYIVKLNLKTRTLNAELLRLEKIIDALEYRISIRNKMIKDYTKLMKYKPKKLSSVPYQKDLNRLKSKLKNLRTAKEVIKELMISGKKIRAYKQNKSVLKSRKISLKIDKLVEKRIKLINLFRNNSDIMDDLYDYAIQSTFNEENGYINYLIVKSDPKGRLKKEASED